MGVPTIETLARGTGSPVVAFVTRPVIWRCCAHARGVPTATSSASETSKERCTTVPPYLVHRGTSSAARKFDDRYVARDSGGPQGGRRTGSGVTGACARAGAWRRAPGGYLNGHHVRRRRRRRR